MQEEELLEAVINGEYKRRVEDLRRLAREEERSTPSPVFRILQILEHLREG